MEGMFDHVYHVSELDLSDFDTSNVTNMKYMFRNMFDLTNLNISSFDISSVTEYTDMFTKFEDNLTITVNNNIKSFIETRLTEANKVANIVVAS